MAKRTAYVHTLDELRLLVAELIDTRDDQVKIEINPLLYAEPELHDILEKLVDLQPRKQSDVETSRKAQEAPETEEAQEAEEIVSYSEDVFGFLYKKIHYHIDHTPEGFRAKISTPCGGDMEPWDFAFTTFEDAELHALAYIDTLTENPEKQQ